MRCSIIVLICLLATIPCSARIITVDNDGAADFNNIQAAINDSNDGDIIEVQPGTYTGNGNRDIDFLGKEILVRSTDPNDPHIVLATIIDCNGTESEPHRGFKFYSGEDSNSMISGLTITNGHAPSDFWRDGHWEISGGAVYCSYSSPTIINCNFTRNYCRAKGGAIYAEESDISIIGCTITDNHSHTWAGGIGIEYGSPKIERCQIRDNYAGQRGGGMMLWKCYAKVTNSLFEGNHSQWCICIYYGGNNIFTNCTIVNNSTNPHGSAICCWHSEAATVINCICRNNTYGDYGTREVSGAHSVTYSNILGGLPGEGNIDVDPNFAFGQDYHLMPGSPCIDAGDNNAVPIWIYSDFDGDIRFYDDINTPDTGKGEVPIVDIGAFEYNDQWPRIAVSASKVEFLAVYGCPNPENTKLYIRNCGGKTLKWVIISDCNWLEVIPKSGFSGGEINEVDLSADITGLSTGSYSTQLMIIDPNVFNCYRIIDVILEIRKPLIEISKNEINFISRLKDVNPDSQILRIRNSDVGTLNWSIDYECTWLTASPLVGISTGEFNDVTLSVDVSGLEKGKYDCNLIVLDPCASNNPQTVKVVLDYYFDDDGILYVPSEYPTIQAAIEISVNGHTVIVADGIYTGEGNRDIDFKGKAITVRSENGSETCIIDCEGTYSDNHRGFNFHSGEGSNSVLDGFTITNGYIVTMCWGGAGIHIDNSSPTIRNCIIKGNVTELDPESLCYCYGGGIYLNDTSLTMTNCIISDNSVDRPGFGGGICCMSDSGTTLRNCIISNNTATPSGQGGGIYLGHYTSGLYMVNCTIAENTASYDGGGIYFEQYENPPSITIINSILWDNLPNQISTDGTDKGVVIYSDVQGGWPVHFPLYPPNMDENPLFADTANRDYHLKSQMGRWNPNQEEWIKDTNTSPCIDSGSGGYDWKAELWPNGKRINIGAYGGTPQASMSLSDAGNIADLNNDGSVDYLDVMLFTDKWPYHEILLAEDLDRNGFVDFIDFAIFSYNWDWKQ